jgi:hypothetical protein
MEIQKGPKALFRWADELPVALWEDLVARTPSEASIATGAEWSEEVFTIRLLGIFYALDPKKRQIWRTGQPDHRVSYESGVVLLTTLAGSKGVPPSGKMVSPQELPGGRLFFTGAHTLNTKALAEWFERRPETLVKRIHSLGGKKVDGADLAVHLPGLPFVPYELLFWRAAEDAPARAIISIDSRAHFHLDLAGIFALSNILVTRLTDPKNSNDHENHV